VVDLNTGFVNGLNTIYFYVEGNGQTDGFEIANVSISAISVPEPETYTMLLAGLGLLGFIGCRKRSRLRCSPWSKVFGGRAFGKPMELNRAG
jgi:hypothetical protein